MTLCLVEANGAGIREALRIILDLEELKHPQIVLIEEPEVHLHPGLARIVADYLREKSREIQMFITTHSTDFVDSASFQDVFLVGKDSRDKTTCQAIEADTGAMVIPAELGLRLSAVFMFDRLVFVEGQSDEGILRALAGALDIDLTKRNVGFVHMGGVRNFAHFAADATLDLLSRRRIRMWFVADRDERDDAEVAQMIGRLGDRARMIVLGKRELENYLLDENGVTAFVVEKRRAAGFTGKDLQPDGVGKAIQEEAVLLKDDVIRLRLERRLLKPLFLHIRTVKGSIEERIRAGIEQLTARLAHISEEQASIAQEIEQQWSSEALNQVPGAILLQRVAKRFGVAFSKDKGDSERLAHLLAAYSISPELKDLLQEIGRDEAPEEPVPQRSDALVHRAVSQG